ncbi:PRP40 pre-mRNA processing factor 40 [Gonapodya sp. JEL0774]|nr:PRP40 pre-mRNA processing factor 40 [Gonapodya sp. JEL0774]
MALNTQAQQAQKYLEEHKISELFQQLTAALLFYKPDDPKDFILKQLETLRTSRKSNLPFFTRDDLHAIFRTFDATDRGYITLAQFREAMRIIGTGAVANPNPKGGTENRIEVAVFIEEALMVVRRWGPPPIGGPLAWGVVPNGPSGFGGPPRGPSMQQVQWTAHQTTDGRTYYYNAATKATTWDKPDELKNPLERALATLPWKEYTDKGSGRKYYSNTQTKQTIWEMPPEWKQMVERYERGESPLDAADGEGPHGAGQQVVVDFRTKEEAEEAFMKLLAETGVDANWSWEQTMRAVISHPMYRALKSLSERKTAYEKYVAEKRRQEREEQRKKYMRDRAEFLKMLGDHEDIKPSTKWRKVVEILKDHPAFTVIPGEKEREQLFEEWVLETRNKEKDEFRQRRKVNMGKFRNLLKSIPQIDRFTRWKDAQQFYKSTPEYQNDAALQAMDALDFLSVFEEHIKQLENDYEEARNRDQRLKRRQERKNREAFWAFLSELVERGILTSTTKWKQIYPIVKDDSRYMAMLGQPGSSPLEMFWDVLTDMEERSQGERKLVSEIMRERNITVTPETSFPLFLAQFSDERVTSVDKNTLRKVYEEQLERAIHRIKEDKRKEERRIRKRMDYFKALLKKVDPPLSGESVWEDVRPLIEDKRDFLDLTEEQRIEVFDYVVKKLRKKEGGRGGGGDDSDEEEDEREEERRRRDGRDRDRKDRDRERERERDRDRSRRDDDRDRERDRDKIDRRDRSRDREREAREKKLRHERPRRDRSATGSDDDHDRKRRKKDDEMEEGEI